jgi:hypothetical protein
MLNGVDDHDTLTIVFRWRRVHRHQRTALKAAVSDRRDRPGDVVTCGRR